MPDTSDRYGILAHTEMKGVGGRKEQGAVTYSLRARH